DTAVCGLGREYTVAACHVAYSVGRTRQKAPARKIGAESLRILLEYLRRVALGIDGDRHEVDLLAKIGTELILHEGHHRREHRAGVRAKREDEGHRHHFAAVV